jgi:hypothetical protein
MVDFPRLLSLLSEASSRINDVQEALNELGAEGQGRDVLELRVEDLSALRQDIDRALVDAGDR